MLFSVLNDISRLLIGQQIFISSIFCGAGHITSKNGVLLISPEWIISFEIRVQPDRGFSRTFLFFIRKDVLNFSIFLEMIFLSHKSKFWRNISIARVSSLKAISIISLYQTITASIINRLWMLMLNRD